MRTILLAALLCSATLSLSTHAASWEERMWVQLNKKVTVDLVDTKLSEAVSFVANYTGATIIIDPKVLKDNPVVNLRVNNMDSGTFIKWLTKLTSTYAQVADHAIYITTGPLEEEIEEEKNDLAMWAAAIKADITLPPKGIALTDADRVQIALKFIEKEDYKPTDFPGPDIGLGLKENNAATPFGKQ